MRLCLHLPPLCAHPAQAFTNPAAYGLIASTFPETRVSTANSIYSSAVYVGGALASLTILLDNQIGWRESSIAIGALGLLLAGASALFLKDPEQRPGLLDAWVRAGTGADPNGSNDPMRNTAATTGEAGAAGGDADRASRPMLGGDGVVGEGTGGGEVEMGQLAGAVGAAKQVLAIPFVQLLFAATAFRFAAGYGGCCKPPACRLWGFSSATNPTSSTS
jgi:hypothetical protein